MNQMTKNTRLPVLVGVIVACMYLGMAFLSALPMGIWPISGKSLLEAFGGIPSTFGELLFVSLLYMIIWLLLVGLLQCVLAIFRFFATPKSKINRPSLVIFVIALAIGVLYNWLVWSAPLSTDDSGAYHYTASLLASNQALDLDSQMRLALYPHVAFVVQLMAKAYALFARSDYAIVKMINAIAGAFTAMLIYKIVMVASDQKASRAASFAALTYALFPMRLIIGSAANTETLSSLFNVLALYLIVRAFQNEATFQTTKRCALQAMLAGALLSISYCLRSDNLILLIALAISAVVMALNKRNFQRMKFVAMYVALLTVCIFVFSSVISLALRVSYAIPIAHNRATYYTLATGTYFDPNNTWGAGAYNTEGAEASKAAYAQYSPDVDKVDSVAMKQLYEQRKQYLDQNDSWARLYFYKSNTFFREYPWLYRVFYNVVNSPALGKELGLNVHSDQFNRTLAFFSSKAPVWSRGVGSFLQLLCTLLFLLIFCLACALTARRSWSLHHFLFSLPFLGSWVLCTFLIEVQSRYAYNYIVILIPAACLMLHDVVNDQANKDFFRKARGRMSGVLTGQTESEPEQSSQSTPSQDA